MGGHSPDSLKSGLVGTKGLLDDEGFRRAAEICAEMEAGEFETVRVCFIDQHGILRGKTLVADALASAFRSGVAMTSTLLLKDTSHRTVFDVWAADSGFGRGVLTGAGDFLMVPDPRSFRPLPWSPHSALILCDIWQADGEALPLSARGILGAAVDRLNAAGMDALFGLEQEFFVFSVTDERLAHGDGGMPPRPPETQLLAHGYQYLTEARYDALEPVMDELRRAALAMDLPVRTMEIEFGPSQFEFTFEPQRAMAAADNAVLFRHCVKSVCARNGLHATFMSRPRVENGMASGWHVHQSVTGLGGEENRFMPQAGREPTPTASGWIAGLLEHAVSGCMLTTPTVNGYKRYLSALLAPDRVQWAHDNKGAMLRALFREGDPASRIENRTPEPAANPHLALASQILAGLDGVTRGLTAPAPVESPYAGDAERLPRNLGAAIEAFAGSAFWRAALGETVADWLTRIKRAEWDRYLSEISEWEHREYFSLF
ncbi:MAG: glutamine synthetase family protein [Zhengella sp.]|uniref:glutamine synthetase family protein n=1 Tax=Zhengella sp. TaxID=2282762 RepID=UPI001D1ED73F|nr:glutamine synthetase [Notoacmeibacter sp.]MCC0026566.1 glutamine synthetase [Brucellaceae bacterium]